MLKEERDNFVGEMSDAEFDYLSSMEEVKMISKQLVKAEQSFTLVRDRIQKLISKYENILMKIETESSIVTFESSYYSDYNSEHWDAIEQKELEMWAKRAKRAEIRAEIAAREAFLAKQETRQLYEDRELELAELKKKLIEFQSEASSPSLGRETSAMIVKSLAMRRNDVIPSNQTAKTVQESKNRISNEKIQDVKQRFRERMAAKKQDSGASISTDSYLPYGEPQVVTPTAYNHNNAKDLFRSAGEEMFQQMDFYERSLNAVERTRF